jgi:hypothetical protein
MDDNTLDIQQNVGDVGGNFTKTIVVDSDITGPTSTSSDVEAGIEFIYNMREHIVDIGIATIYGLIVYAAVLWITKKIKG